MNTIAPAALIEDILRRDTDAEPSRPARVCRAIISQILDSGEIIVHLSSGPDMSFACDALSGGGCLVLKSGDSVLVLAPATVQERGVVLGLVGPYVPPSQQTTESVEHRVIDAQESLALKCGESSIELRKDGKVLVKGKDVVSHAQRVQRIKGGTVAIN